MIEAEREKHLPVGFIEAKSVGDIVIGADLLPWLNNKESKNVSVAQVTLDSGQSAMLASFVSEKLSEVAELANRSRKNTDNYFYQLVRRLMRKEYSAVPRLQNACVDFSVYYCKAHDFRVWVIVMPASEVSQVFPSLPNGMDLLIRIAVAEKSHEIKVLKYISTKPNDT